MSEGVVSREALAKERLLYVLAEQLKLPLLQIARQAELGQMTTTGLEQLNSIEVTANTALKLLDNYLLGLKLNAPNFDSFLEPVSVAAVLAEAAHQLSDIAKQYNCQIEMHLSGRYEPVMANHDGLLAALISLGYVFIEAQAAQPTKNKPVIKLAAHRGKRGIVAGMFGQAEGLSADMYRRSKQLYGRAHQPITGLSSTTGAGVFIADSLLNSMSARLRVAHHQKIVRTGRYSKTQLSTRPNMKNILLLEPDAVLGQTFVSALASQGYKVNWQTNAQAAIHATDENLPDVVVAELQLPTHNGVEFLYELRSYNDWQNLPVIVLSQVPADAEALKTQLKVSAYHYKPRTSLAELISSIKSVLS